MSVTNEFFNKDMEAYLPINFMLSLERFQQNEKANIAPLGEREEDTHYNSSFHQNSNKISFEGFYKSITRKI